MGTARRGGLKILRPECTSARNLKQGVPQQLCCFLQEFLVFCHLSHVNIDDGPEKAVACNYMYTKSVQGIIIREIDSIMNHFC